jgi:hypothetical protein
MTWGYIIAFVLGLAAGCLISRLWIFLYFLKHGAG